MKFAALLSSCLIVALPLKGYALKAQNPVDTLRVGIYQNKPKVFLDEAGKPAGFWVDLLEYIADVENWSLEYVPCQWDRCLQAVEQGQLDLMMDVAYSEERDRVFDFNQEVVLASWSVVYTRSGLKLDSMLDLDQKRVAVLKESIQYAILEERTKNFGIKPQFVEVADFHEMFRLLDRGDADAGVVKHFFGKEIESQYQVDKTHILIAPSRVHFIFPQGQHADLRTGIDRQLRKLTADSNSAYYQALERWLEPEGRLGWAQIKHILLNLTVYVPIVGLIVVLVWNRLLNQEVNLRKRTEARLQESEERYRSIYEQAAVGLANATLDGKFLKVNPRFCEMLGYSQEELLAKTVLEITHPDDRALISPAMKRLFAGEVPSFFQEKRYLCQDGSCFWSSTSVSLVRDSSGNPKHALAVIRDISDRIKAEKQLKHDAFHDSLTGLPNRNLLMERIDLAFKRAKRHPEFQFALLFLDLDNFKVINDSLGHLIGDELLLAVVEQLKKCIRETDLAARLGGDEFVILLEELDDIEEAVRVAERILEFMRSPFRLNDREVFTSTSIGIVVGSTSYQSAEDLLRDADLAMYRAKQSGRGQYAIFDPAMQLQVKQRLHLENDLRKALENDEFTLYYQPIFDLETDVIQGFETLIRWQHPQRGFVPPGEFIEIAEETELIMPIGQWILHTACQQLAAWQAQFPTNPLKMSVNLSVKQMQSSLLPELEEVLTTYNLQDNSLGLEITESMLVQNVEVTRTLLEQIKAEGICLSIDDFGTGYSSLSYLNQLPVDTLKIDRTFVSPPATNTRNQVIAESVIALSNSLGLKAIAEGIETPQQLQWLKGLDCELGQGFLFSPPVTAAQATELLKQSFR